MFVKVTVNLWISDKHMKGWNEHKKKNQFKENKMLHSNVYVYGLFERVSQTSEYN